MPLSLTKTRSKTAPDLWGPLLSESRSAKELRSSSTLRLISRLQSTSRFWGPLPLQQTTKQVLLQGVLDGLLKAQAAEEEVGSQVSGVFFWPLLFVCQESAQPEPRSVFGQSAGKESQRADRRGESPGGNSARHSCDQQASGVLDRALLASPASASTSVSSCACDLNEPAGPLHDMDLLLFHLCTLGPAHRSFSGGPASSSVR